MKRRTYAGEITKDYLKKLGVEHVTTDGKFVIKNSKLAKIHVNKNAAKPYGLVSFYDPDLYASVPAEEKRPSTGVVIIGVHVLNYVWNKEDKPQGMVIDHIDNNPLNNDLSNLQMITQGENIAKERDNWHVYETKCKLNKPRSFYEDKLAGYEAKYEEAKANSDAEATHKLRTNISQCRARLRYYDNHLEEAKNLQLNKEAEDAQKREYHERALKKKELKANVDSAHKYYKQARDTYGKDDPTVKQYWAEWKLAIATLHDFEAKTKSAV